MDNKRHYTTLTKLFACTVLVGLMAIGSANAQTHVVVHGSVFGGGNEATVSGNTEVLMQQNATVKTDVYGGGAFASTGTNGSNTTVVTIEGGTVGDADYGTDGKGNVFGGALGDATHSPDVNGAITVNIGTSTQSSNNVVVKGNIFGCNNAAGTPKDSVRVHIYHTAHTTDNAVGTYNDMEEFTDFVKNDAAAHAPASFALQSVYGGGNKADYTPASGKGARVHIHNCDNTVKMVYGGGRAAAVGTNSVNANTSITVDGGRIDTLFAGGDGHTKDGSGNYLAADIYGNVSAWVRCGYYSAVFGASNTSGTITGTKSVTIDYSGPCANDVDDEFIVSLFGGGNAADISGDVELTIACGAGEFDEVYGGSNMASIDNGDVTLNLYGGKYHSVFGGSKGVVAGAEANIDGDVTLNLYGGTMVNAFGGSNQNGNITGAITVNVLDKETANCELRIDSLYGAGNVTAYTPDDATIISPVVNLMHINNSGAGVTGDVFGGGLGLTATVTANPQVNIGYNATTQSSLKPAGYSDPAGFPHAFVGNNVYGGGSQASVSGNTSVNMFETDGDLAHTRIGNSIFGAGKGSSDSEADTVVAKVTGNTAVNIAGGLVVKNVYGGGELAAVGGNAQVALSGTGHIGANAPTSTDGFLFGGGKGTIDNPVFANVKGNTHVTMSGGYVHNTLFGGGELASVGSFTTATSADAEHDIVVGEPISCKSNTGRCLVEISGGQVGHKDATLRNDIGYVFGAGMGVYTDPHAANEPVPSADNARFGYVNTAEVQVSGSAFIVGAVWGGSENGQVLDSCGVKVSGGQIGNGYDWVNKVGKGLYTAANWDEAVAAVKAQDATRINTIAAAMPECMHWKYGYETTINGTPTKHYLPYDRYANETGDTTASYNPGDGHTFFGNVFGGGSGYYPYAIDNRGSGGSFTTQFYEFQGRVRGNTYVEISGGHILTSVYGGCEYADVLGDCRVVMTGGTLGLPRTIDSITDHPVTSYLFGAGKGDQRTEFNMRTNVQNVNVKVSGGLIFGSVFGGGEDGHVLGDAKVTIDSAAWVGTWGTSYVDGNIFGGGRGFGGTAYTAGSIGGNVEVNINNDTVGTTPVRPTMLGSVYGGGRLASVGSYFVAVGDPNYSQLQDGDDHGNITINITGGTIGNLSEFTHPVFNPATSYSVGDVVAYQNQMYRFTSAHPAGAWNQAHVTDIVHTTGGNVFGSSMGRLFKLGATDETDPNSFLRIWPGMAKCKNTEINISGDATIYSNVYGGGELGYVMKDTKVTIDGSQVTIGHGVATGTTDACYLGSVYGGGYGSDNIIPHINDTASITSTSGFVSAAMHAGRVYGNTEVELKNGHILGNIYGGGELASVGRRWRNMTYAYDPSNPYKFQPPYNGTAATYNYEVNGVTYTSYGYSANVGNTKVTVSGGKVGEVDNVTVGTDRVAGHSTGRKGSVFGGSKGRPGYYDTINDIDYGFHYTRMAYVDQTQVIISGGQIAASVFGGGENGHVRYDATVTMTGGTVGLELTAGEKELDANGEARVDIYHGNVYGGGRGIDVTQDDYLGEASGQVFGNTNVDISGGTVRHHVFGGGSIASVGTYVAYPIVPGDHAEASTGKATVTIHGGVIGSDGMNNGFVYGSGRGVAYSGSDFAHKAFVNNTEVNIQDGADVRGSVFGGGANGHVMTDTKVNISGGTIGSPINSTDWTLPVAYHPSTLGAEAMVGTEWVKYPTNDPSDPNYNDYMSQLGESAVTHYHGNVYGGGRGVDRHDGNFSTTAGRVYGNTNVDVSGGIIYHNVYGGGSMASVGYYNEVPITPHSTILSGGIATVTIRGGQIGTTGHNNGHVFGSSRGMAGSEYSHFAFTEDTYVNIQTGADIRGSVFGSGENGHVLNNTYVTMTGGKVGRDLTVKATLLDDGTTELVTGEACTEEAGADASVIFRGNVYGGGRGVDRHNGKLSLSAGTVYGNTHVTVSGGTVTHNVYGGGSMASVGSTLYFNGTDTSSYEPVRIGTSEPPVFYDTVGKPERSHRYKDSHGEYTSRIPVETPCTWRYKTSADATEYTSDTRVANPATGDYYDSIKCWMNPTTGNYTETSLTYYDNVGADTITGMAIVTISSNAIIGNAGEYVVDRKGFNNGRVFGAGRGMAGGAYAARANVYNTIVTINGGTVNGSVFGGGENGHVLHNTRVTVNDGTIGHNMNASYAAVETMFGSSQPAMVPIMKSRMANVGNVYGAGRGCDLAHDGTYSMSAGYVRGNTVVNINGGTIHRNVYGGGSMALVGDYGLRGTEDHIQDTNSGLATVNIHSSVGDAGDNVGFGGNVFGSSRGRANDPNFPNASNPYDFADMAYAFKTQVNVGNDAGTENLTIYRNVYGGGEAGHVDYGGTTVNIKSGTVKGNVFGGGMGASTSPTAGIVDGNTQVNIGLESQSSNNVVIGTSGDENTGNVFGGNDAGSSPLGVMRVDVWHTGHTVANTCPTISTLTDSDKEALLVESTASNSANYALLGVYGGGNQASVLTGDPSVDAPDWTGAALAKLNTKYITQRLDPSHNGNPAWAGDTSRLSKVVIHYCDENTVKYVYGGGRAANTLQNDVTIEGGRVYMAFAGGDGHTLDPNTGNPLPANVKKSTVANMTSTGNVAVRVQGGIVFDVFGGSNTSGIIEGKTSIDLTPVSPCELINNETFGGGNEAVGGGGIIDLLCGNKFTNFYGGARNANINGDITLNVRGGEYDTIFGGNKDGGVIDGNVTVNFYGGQTKCLFGGSNKGGNILKTITVNVNIQPDPSCPDVRLDYVYGGGKDAFYTPSNPSLVSPIVNIINDEITTDVFGGGLGETAIVTANPKVAIGTTVSGSNAVTILRNVFGGGSQAAVVGNTTIDVRGEKTVVVGNVYGGGNQAPVSGNTDVHIGNTAEP